MAEATKVCGATNQSGNKCLLPPMANGRCRIHGGKTTGPLNPRVKHGLYRKYMSPEEMEMFDGLKHDENYADMRGEAALLRVMIERCAKAILGGDMESYRVPMQVLPQYMEKLIKVLDKLEPSPANPGRMLENSLDDELKQMLKEEDELRGAEQGFADSQ
jgi:hypothetical protein